MAKLKTPTILMLTILLGACVTAGLKSINGLAKFGKYKVYENISYAKFSENTLNVYTPEDKKIKATILFFYGGCWGHCTDKGKKDYLFVADTLTKQGYAVIIPDYRQYPQVKFNSIIKDAKKATLWTIKHLKEYQLQDTPVFIMGHSSGAHIGATLVDDERFLAESLKHISGFIGLAGPYDFYPFNGDYMYDLFSKDNDYHDSQPINFINGNEPPHLLLQGKNDNRVFPHNAINLSKKLNENNVSNELIIYEKMAHARILVSLSKPLRRHSKVLKAINEFIERHKKGG